MRECFETWVQSRDWARGRASLNALQFLVNDSPWRDAKFFSPFKPCFIHSVFLSLTASLYKDNRCFAFARCTNMWSLLFGLSLAIFYKSLSPHAELEGLMAVLARAVIYIHIDRNKQMAINSGQRQTSVTIILDNLFIQDFVCQLQLLCSIVDTLH